MVERDIPSSITKAIGVNSDHHDMYLVSLGLMSLRVTEASGHTVRTLRIFFPCNLQPVIKSVYLYLIIAMMVNCLISVIMYKVNVV